MNRVFERAAIAVGFTVALYPLLSWYLRRMGDGGDEPLGLVALATASVLAFRSRGGLTPAHGAGVILLAVYGLTVWLSLPPMIRAVPALAAVAAWWGLWRRPPVLALLLLSLPVVASLQFYAGYPLRVLAAQFAEAVLSFFGMAVTLSGVEILYAGVPVRVDPPCSGVRMLWVSCFLAAAFAGRARLGWWATAFLGGCAVFLAVFANALRATVLFFPEAGLVTWPHWTHEATGAALFAATGAILLTTANCLHR